MPPLVAAERCYQKGDVCLTVIQDNDGWTNATVICSAFNKLIRVYLKSKRTRDLIAALTSKHGDVLRAQRGGNGESWIAPCLLPDLAAWVSADFAAWLRGDEGQEAEPQEETFDHNTESPDHAIVDFGLSEFVERSFEHNLLKFNVSRCGDGFFNGTAMCTAFGKLFADYIRTERAKEYIKALRVYLDGTDMGNPISVLMHVQHGGPFQGSWIHPRLAVDLARWLCSYFAVWIDGWVLEGLSQAPAGPRAQIFAAAEVIQDEHSIGLEGAEHLYCASRVGESVLKVGVTKDILERLKTLATRWENSSQLLAIWPNEAALEDLVHAQLKPSRAPVGTSREHFHASLQEVREAVKAARDLYRISVDLKRVSREEREFEADLADRAAKRQKMLLEANAEASKTMVEADNERLLARLVSEGNEAAIPVFLRRMDRR
jgi:hypothetical protein